jgi:hypothetical protein
MGEKRGIEPAGLWCFRGCILRFMDTHRPWGGPTRIQWYLAFQQQPSPLRATVGP